MRKYRAFADALANGSSTKATFAQAFGECHGRVQHDAHHNG
jgi:hypothetical protein